jgi:hypothetical protein
VNCTMPSYVDLIETGLLYPGMGELSSCEGLIVLFDPAASVEKYDADQ